MTCSSTPRESGDPPHSSCDGTALDALLDEKPKGHAEATRLVSLMDGAQFFHSPSGDAFATVDVEDHQETLQIRSGGFKSLLIHRYYRDCERASSTQAIYEAVNLFAARATCDGPEVPVFIRVAQHGSAIYIDLGGPDWKAVQITAAGYEGVSRSPVKFYRARGMAPLPEPQEGGHLSQLREFVNATDDDLVLAIAWLLASLRPTGPYPVLVISGPQGSAKTTLTKILRELLDPSTVTVRAEPKDIRDLMIAMKNAWCLALDNLSSLPRWLSDALCRLSTGGGHATRQLHTDFDEVLFEAQRPCMLNGIEELATRSDLLERSLVLNLPAIPDRHRRSEAELWQSFNLNRPRLLGALYHAISVALANPHVHLEHRPRMADFAEWVVAAEGACPWPKGEFLKVYRENREDAKRLAVDASPVVVPIRRLLTECKTWKGTATELFGTLTSSVDDTVRRGTAWPKSVRALTGILRRLQPDLPVAGIEVAFDRATTSDRTRLIALKRANCSVAQSSACTDVAATCFEADELRRSDDEAEDDLGDLDDPDDSDCRSNPNPF